MSMDTRPTTMITINPERKSKTSLGSQPRSILMFHDLGITSVATCRLLKRLGPYVEVERMISVIPLQAVLASG